MSNFIVIFVSLLAGVLLKRSVRFPEKSAQAFNSYVIYLSYPALVLVQFPHLLGKAPEDTGFLIPATMPWILFGLSWLVFSLLGKRLGWSRESIGALILTAGLGNTSFVGFPLLSALVGVDAIRVGILCDQLGSFLALSTIGLVVASIYSGASLDFKSVALRILKFPPFISLVAATAWFYCGLWGYPTLKIPLEMIAATLVPVALFAVGLQMEWNWIDLKAQRLELFLGLGFKLVLAPIIFFKAYQTLFGKIDFISHVTILESAMAPMITAAIVAGEFGLNARLATLMLGIGIPISLMTVSVWHIVIG